ncbi:ParB N-terminal domain-containing protein [Clostridium sp. UBA3061]|uniref:ParB N-terminal domain-containing protein n=1 Tax=Clostridium sp. UBA3061 TaxID=1946353 RepID=UPI003217B0DC
MLKIFVYVDIEGEQYEKFKKSIEEDGILTPLIVSPDMTIISGHQRYQASKDLGIQLIPVIIKEDLIEEDEKLKNFLQQTLED